LGEIRPIVVKAYVVPGLKHDLISVKGLNQAGYRVIHDEDEEESGVFAVINKKIDKAKSFPFMSEHSNFFSLKLEQMSATQFEKQSEYELWHRRLGHSSNRNIRDSAVVFVDKCTGYRWMYGMKTKDQMINVLKRWYIDIADLRTKHRLVVVVSDNASENKSQEVKEFF
jgi:hypothetical protein